MISIIIIWTIYKIKNNIYYIYIICLNIYIYPYLPWQGSLEARSFWSSFCHAKAWQSAVTALTSKSGKSSQSGKSNKKHKTNRYRHRWPRNIQRRRNSTSAIGGCRLLNFCSGPAGCQCWPCAGRLEEPEALQDHHCSVITVPPRWLLFLLEVVILANAKCRVHANWAYGNRICQKWDLNRNTAPSFDETQTSFLNRSLCRLTLILKCWFCMNLGPHCGMKIRLAAALQLPSEMVWPSWWGRLASWTTLVSQT